MCALERGIGHIGLQLAGKIGNIYTMQLVGCVWIFRLHERVTASTFVNLSNWVAAKNRRRFAIGCQNIVPLLFKSVGQSALQLWNLRTGCKHCQHAFILLRARHNFRWCRNNSHAHCRPVNIGGGNGITHQASSSPQLMTTPCSFVWSLRLMETIPRGRASLRFWAWRSVMPLAVTVPCLVS